MKPRGVVAGACAWIVCILLASAALAQDARLAEAERRFTSAERIYENGDYAGALAEFLYIHELLEGHPRRFFVLYNIGRCNERLYRYDQALAAYHRYLDEGGQATDLATTVRQKIAELEPLLAWIDIRTNVSSEVWVDGHQVGTAPGEVRVTGGQHVIELRAHGHAPGRAEVRVPAQTRQSLELNLERTSPGIHPAFFLTGVGLTAASGAVALGFGVSALAAQSTLEDQLASSDTRQRFMVTQRRIDAMREQALLSDIFLGVTGGLAIASVVLLFVTDWGGDPDRTSARLRLVPFASSDTAGLGVLGRFQ